MATREADRAGGQAADTDPEKKEGKIAPNELQASCSLMSTHGRQGATGNRTKGTKMTPLTIHERRDRTDEMEGSLF